MYTSVKYLLKVLFIVLLVLCHWFMKAELPARANLHVVGSSVIFPYSVLASENFSRFYHYNKPLIESNGTGVGIELFCSGNGLDTPDIVNASRPMHQSEKQQCQENGVLNIQEYQIGYDAIILAQDRQGILDNLTSYEVFLAVSKYIPQNDQLIPNPFYYWSDINPKLPKTKIIIFGPSLSSGTYEIFVEYFVKKQLHKLTTTISTNASITPIMLLTNLAMLIRDDGHYIETIDSPNIIIQKILNNSYSLGVISFGFVLANSDFINVISIDGIVPTLKSITELEYPLIRPLFLYAKDTTIPGINEFIDELVNNKQLEKFGLIHPKQSIDDLLYGK